MQQIEIARANFKGALASFERAIEAADEEAFARSPAELEMARIDGWLEAIRAVAATPMLVGHEIVRQSLIEELENKLHQYATAVEEGRLPCVSGNQ